MQQLSGSSGRGGTMTPAISLLLLRMAANRSARSAGPERLEPKTTRALASAVDGVVSDGVGIGGDEATEAVAVLDSSSLGLRPRGSAGEGAGASSVVDVGGSSGFSFGIGCGS
jgi:hypothetical protein